MALSTEQIRTLAQPWIAPVRPDSPAGGPSRELPVYQRLVGEVEKLESPTGGSVRWKQVVEDGGELLKSHSKDLRVASYLAYGLLATEGLPGFLAGTTLLSELLETYWLTLYPEATRLRGRVNALSWFISRSAAALANVAPGASDREAVDSLVQATARLADVTRKCFGQDGPALGPVLDAVERLRLTLPPEAPPSGAASAQTAPALTPPEDVSSPEAVLAFARELGGQLVTAAAGLRRAKPDEPLGYRLLRTGLWLSVTAVPVAEASGKSRVPPPPPPLRERMEKLAANAKWAELLEETESALSQHRLWLDLNRLSAQALSGLGDGHANARAAVVAATASLLLRLPGLDALTYSDGSPSVDGQTRRWLETELPSTAVSKPQRGSPMTEGVPRLEEALGLLRGGKASEAFALLQETVRTAPNDEVRFQARLALAEACSGSGQTEVARALYAALDTEGQQLKLDSWNPPLAAKCLLGLLIATRHSKKTRPGLDAEADALYKRLCQIDPAAALRLGS